MNTYQQILIIFDNFEIIFIGALFPPETAVRGEEEVRYGGGQSGAGGCHVGQIPRGPFCHLSLSPAAPASRFFSPRRS